MSFDSIEKKWSVSVVFSFLFLFHFGLFSLFLHFCLPVLCVSKICLYKRESADRIELNRMTLPVFRSLENDIHEISVSFDPFLFPADHRVTFYILKF